MSWPFFLIPAHLFAQTAPNDFPVALIPPALAILLVIYLIYLASKRIEERKRRHIAEAEREAHRQQQEANRLRQEANRLQQYREGQQRCREQMIALGQQSVGLFETMPNYLSAAENHLDQADFDFAEGAFAPFWDAIEKAAIALGHFAEGVRGISRNSSRYTELIREYADTPPEFPLAPQSVAKLGVGTATANRMKTTVRNAQRNFQFATIYEQRKTNQILVAGFTNLAQALDQMTQQISASIGDLANSVDAMTSTFDQSMRAIHSRIGQVVEQTAQLGRTLSKESSERAQRERKALEMLDNIQRGKRPLL